MEIISPGSLEGATQHRVGLDIAGASPSVYTSVSYRNIRRLLRLA